MAAWVPILESARASEVIDAIAEAMREPPPPYGGRLHDDALAVALFGREPGFALFHAYLARALLREDHEELAHTCLATAAERLPLALHRPYFAYGFSGLAWALQHLDGADDDSLEALDVAVARAIEHSSEYALAKGLVGYGIYARERMPRASARSMIEQIVERLEALAERSPTGIAWRVPVEQVNPHVERDYPDGMLIVGVLEGTVGVIATLAAAASAGIARETADELIRGALTWLAACVEDGVPTIAGGKLAPPTWAHGDVGIAAALVATERPDCRELGLMIGRRAATRATDASVRDASVLRGTAGIAHSFNRLFQLTGEELFRVAALSWLDATLDLYRPGTGFGGYRFWADEWVSDYIPELEGGWTDEPGVLEGVAGVGLVLLAATTELLPEWDRCLLLSRRP